MVLLQFVTIFLLEEIALLNIVYTFDFKKFTFFLIKKNVTKFKIWSGHGPD